MRTNSADTIWWTVVAIAFLTVCIFAAVKYCDTPQRDTGTITVNYNDQVY